MILKIPHIPKYEPHYRMAWEIQNKKDADNKKCMLFSNKKLVDAQYKNAQKGAIRREAKQKEMPEQVKIINRMLKNHMTQSTIASILGISQNAVSKAKSRYSLPKEEFLKL
tara:strand:- start:153 stop:485 length:333 start_codon:yes stop_codon:yes gene_type:complete